jgi:hypothetical protein
MKVIKISEIKVLSKEVCVFSVLFLEHYENLLKLKLKVTKAAFLVLWLVQRQWGPGSQEPMCDLSLSWECLEVLSDFTLGLCLQVESEGPVEHVHTQRWHSSAKCLFSFLAATFPQDSRRPQAQNFCGLTVSWSSERFKYKANLPGQGLLEPELALNAQRRHWCSKRQWHPKTFHMLSLLLSYVH